MFLILIIILLLSLSLNVKLVQEFVQFSHKIDSYDLLLRSTVLKCKKLEAKLNIDNYKSYVSEDIKIAVKYAMKKAHPDNGGEIDNFIKFKTLYEKIK